MPTRYFSRWYALALLVGAVLAVLVFWDLFGDTSRPTVGALLPRIGMAAAIYGVVGAVFGGLRPGESWEWGFRVTAPAMVALGFVGLMALRHMVFAGFLASAGALCAVLLASSLGGMLGARLSPRQRAEGTGRFAAD